MCKRHEYTGSTTHHVYKLKCKRCKRTFESVTHEPFCLLCEIEVEKETQLFLKYVMGEDYEKG